MSMVINTNIQATRTHNVYSRNNDYMNAAMTRVATGMKINSAKDGASTWAISEKMRERIRANDQANQNVQNDTALLKTAQGGVSNTIDILKTLKERAVNAANDSNMNEDRDRIGTEVQQLLAQIDDNATKVKFNGRKLLDGTGATDNTGKGLTASSSTGSVTAADKVNPPDNTTGSNALFTLAKDSTSTLESLGFKANDVIKFSWKEGGTETSESITVSDISKTLADLVSEFGTSGTSSKLTLADVAASGNVVDSASNNVTKSDGTAITNTGTTAALYAIGASDETQITDLAVSVTGEDGNTNTTAQAAMKFTGVQQATQTPTGDYAVYAAGITSSATISDTMALGDITEIGSIAASKDFTIKANGTVIGTFTTTSSTNTVTDLLGTTLTTGYKLGFQTTAGSVTAADGTTTVKDSDGNNASVAANSFYLVGPSGTAVTSFSIEYDGNEKLAGTAVQNYKAASTTNTTNNNSGGSSTELTFHIGGEQALQMTANISSMKVENLFQGYDQDSFANLFTNKTDATKAIGLIDTALTTALNEQTKLGAYESRLGYTSDNLTTMNENLEAADSVMRDSDVAKEMTQYMKYSVLAQASQYMLAQAGQNAFSVLNLLQA